MRPFAEAADPAVRRDVRGQEPGDAGRAARSDRLMNAACQAASTVVPETQCRSTVKSTSRCDLGRVEQVCPQGVVTDERRAERVLMVLGILGEQRDPGVAVERPPRPAP